MVIFMVFTKTLSVQICLMQNILKRKCSFPFWHHYSSACINEELTWSWKWTRTWKQMQLWTWMWMIAPTPKFSMGVSTSTPLETLSKEHQKLPKTTTKTYFYMRKLWHAVKPSAIVCHVSSRIGHWQGKD